MQLSYVYLLRAGEDHYKVGVAKSVKNRVAGIQTSNPVKIQIVSTKLLDDAYAVEGQLHQHLKQWNVSGEWFQLEPKQVIDLLIKISEYPEPNLAMNIRLRDILANQSEIQRQINQKLKRVTDLALTQLQDRQKRIEQSTNLRLNDTSIVRPKAEKITDDELIYEAIEICKTQRKASTSLLQRKLQIGYGRAARIIEKLEEQGMIGAGNGAKAREVIIA